MPPDCLQRIHTPLSACALDLFGSGVYTSPLGQQEQCPFTTRLRGLKEDRGKSPLTAQYIVCLHRYIAYASDRYRGCHHASPCFPFRL